MSEQGEGETLQSPFGISGTGGLLGSHSVIHFQGKGDTRDRLPSHPEGMGRPAGRCPWIPLHVHHAGGFG